MKRSTCHVSFSELEKEKMCSHYTDWITAHQEKIKAAENCCIQSDAKCIPDVFKEKMNTGSMVASVDEDDLSTIGVYSEDDSNSDNGHYCPLLCRKDLTSEDYVKQISVENVLNQTEWTQELDENNVVVKVADTSDAAFKNASIGESHITPEMQENVLKATLQRASIQPRKCNHSEPSEAGWLPDLMSDSGRGVTLKANKCSESKKEREVVLLCKVAVLVQCKKGFKK